MTTIDVLRAVHHPTRRRIVEYLYIHDASQVGSLARDLQQQVGSISHHLRMLERAGVVERVPELAVDGRTSWWRCADTRIAWNVEDFADNPADLVQARAAERLNLEHQLRRLADWQRRSPGYDQAWRQAAFSNDGLVRRATAEELGELSRLLSETIAAWQASIDTDDGREREPVFWFARGFPVRP